MTGAITFGYVVLVTLTLERDIEGRSRASKPQAQRYSRGSNGNGG